ncbi:MAG: VOC family protein [Myxococcota bacterium]
MSTNELTNEAARAMGYDGALTISLQVRNLDEALTWYQSVLGFELVYRVDEIRWGELRSPVAKVTVGLAEAEEPAVTGNTPVWGVGDLASVRAYLESKGVRFDGPTQDIPDMVKLATFFDPDGNPHMIAETPSETAT